MTPTADSSTDPAVVTSLAADVLLLALRAATSPPVVQASPTVAVVALDGLWRMAPDAPGVDEAAAALDDRDWEQVPIAGGAYREQARLDHPDAAAVWYRTVVRLPWYGGPAWDTGDLAVSVGTVSDGATVYADGERLGAVGRAADPPTTPARRGHVFPVPARLAADGELVLAVRAVQDERLRVQPGGIRYPRLGQGLYLLGPADAVQARVDAAALTVLVGRIIPEFAIGAVIAALGLFMLSLYRRRRDLHAELLFTFLALLLAGGCLVYPLTDLGVVPLVWRHGWDQVFHNFAMALGVPFIFALAGRAPRWRVWGWPVGFLVVLGGVRGVLGAPARAYLPQWIDHATWILMLAALTVVMLRSDRERRGTLRGFAVAFCLVLVLVALELLGYYGGVEALRGRVAPRPGDFPSLVFAVAMASQLGRNFTANLDHLDHALRDLEVTHAATRRFVPLEFLDVLGRQSIRDIQRGDARTLDMTIFFADIRSFTTLSEKLTPLQVFELVNDHLAALEPTLSGNGGFVDKYIGDAIMALFWSADAATGAALACLAQLDRSNAARRARGEPPVEIGIGLHSGRVTLGTVGSPTRLSCTVMGDAVNLASRVEALTRTYGARLLVTEQTRAALTTCADVPTREVDRVRVKGKVEPVVVHEVIGAEPTDVLAARLATRGQFQEGLAAWRAGRFGDAAGVFAAITAAHPDGAAALYADRALAAVADPPRNWDGITTLHSK